MSEVSNQEEDTFTDVCTEILLHLSEENAERDEVERIKREVCRKHSAPRMPTNGDLLDYATPELRDELRPILQRKPTRTQSGVSPVAIMTSPHRCPHGKCLYCPGGPDSEFSSSQAYTGDEPASRRAEHSDYDPYAQVTRRLSQLQHIGHPVDKIELILMGGTMTARSHDYQEWFVKRALRAMNDYDPSTRPDTDRDRYRPSDLGFEYTEDVKAANEHGNVKCIGITFETKPDWCGREQVNRMLRLGGTKVEVGVQTTYERINREMHRGHGQQASIDANHRLRDAGFKVGFHMMPGQPGMSKEMCRQDFKELWNSPEWRPDYLKIYPTLITKGTITYDWWKKGKFEPLTSEEAAELVAEIMEEIPEYVRLQRVQRDIPADNIEAGVQKSNLRQLAQQKMEENGGSCDCIRSREVGFNDEDKINNVILDTITYESCGGTEHFIQFKDEDTNVLIGFCRLRFPGNPYRKELQNSAIVRELHVYGSEVSIGDESNEWQHKGYGKKLINEAERKSKNNGYDKLSIISGIGARQYYKQKLNYQQDGPYVSKKL